VVDFRECDFSRVESYLLSVIPVTCSPNRIVGV
jgi:hypothetical protein